jgi:hypothetical protein
LANHGPPHLDRERPAADGRGVSRIGRRAERAFLGAVMAMLAFMVERRVLRALKRTR